VDRARPPYVTADQVYSVRVAVSLTRSKLHVVQYSTGGGSVQPSKALITPRDMDRPRDFWEVSQGLLWGVELVIGKYYP